MVLFTSVLHGEESKVGSGGFEVKKFKVETLQTIKIVDKIIYEVHEKFRCTRENEVICINPFCMG